MKDLIHNNKFYFYKRTPQIVMDIINRYHRSNERLLFSYGDPNTGKDWEERYDVEGYIGRTTGSMPISILLYNSRSIGGSAILTDHVVRIRLARGKKVLYEHPLYHKTNKELVDKTANII